jgi:hypothetical protein
MSADEENPVTRIRHVGYLTKDERDSDSIRSSAQGGSSPSPNYTWAMRGDLAACRFLWGKTKPVIALSGPFSSAIVSLWTVAGNFVITIVTHR